MFPKHLIPVRFWSEPLLYKSITYLLFSWSFYYGFAVNLAVHCSGQVFCLNLGVFVGR